MPQKVLTDANLRGQGVFGKVYSASEQACRRGADFFLTVTNAASTPIFLGKFGYQRTAVPRMAALLPCPGERGCTDVRRMRPIPPRLPEAGGTCTRTRRAIRN